MNTQAPVNHLAVLLELEARTRSMETLAELRYFLANDPYTLSPFRQSAVLDAQGKVVALSGVDTVNNSVPYVQWLNEVLGGHVQNLAEPQMLVCTELSADAPQWLPQHVVLLPVLGKGNVLRGSVLLAREQPWQNDELPILMHLMSAAGFAWDGFVPRQSVTPLRHVPTKVKYGAAIAAVLVLFFPVHLTVLAEAEIVPQNPSIIRAPMNGIVDRIVIEPNQEVVAGQVLLQMDDQDLRNERLVAVKIQQGLAAQYRQVTRQVLIDPKGKAQLTILAAQIKEKQARVQQLDNMLERTQILAPHAATVVMDDAQDWIGRPVQVGERIMALADESKTEIEAWLPVADAIELPQGADVTVFLNATPLSPIDAKVKRVAYEAVERPNGIMAYRVLATIDGEQPDARPGARLGARLGAQGTARLEGERVPLIYWVFRRPLAVIRQFLGV